MIKSTLFPEGKFYKGNLHTHTTISDGAKTPEEIVSMYKNKAYDFLSITDHEIYGIHENLNSEDFLILPGVELTTTYNWKEPLWSVHHLLAIGDPDKNTYKHGYKFDESKTYKMNPQKLIDKLKANGNLVIYNHPYWSKVQFEDIVHLKGLNGMEIYNHNCQCESRSGDGEVFYDHFLWNNNNIWCYGTDDAHMNIEDCFGGYITVKSNELSHRSIYNALVKGSFYASKEEFGYKAPEIKDFYVENNTAKIFTSPACKIYFMTESDFIPLTGEDLTYAEYEIPDSRSFVRAVCVTSQGSTSWTQPIVL